MEVTQQWSNNSALIQKGVTLEGYMVYVQSI